MRCKCRLFLSFVRERHVPETRHTVQATEIFRSTELIQDVVNPWERVDIFLRNHIQLTVVHAEAQLAVLFLHQNHPRRPRALRRFYHFCSEHIVEMLFDDFLMCLGAPVRVLFNRDLVTGVNRVNDFGRSP